MHAVVCYDVANRTTVDGYRTGQLGIPVEADVGQSRVESFVPSPARLRQLQPSEDSNMKGRSMEIAPLEVLNGVYTAADDKQVTVIIGFDLSAASQPRDLTATPAS